MTAGNDRYHRQMLLPGIGEQGQRRLREATVAVLGCGALGSMAADMLCRAGVGRLLLVDRDFVELTNLQRQVLYDEQDVADALPKAVAAKRRLARVNSGIVLEPLVEDLDAANIGRLLAGADLLVDGLDNFETRYLVNDYAVRTGLPWTYGGAVGTEGMAFTILPRTPTGAAPWETGPEGDLATPCLRCLFEEPPPPGQAPTCDTVGVLGPVVALVANLQVSEALKVLTGQYARVARGLFTVDLWNNTLLRLEADGARTDGACPCCGQRRFDYLDARTGSQSASLCGREAVQLRHRQQAGDLDLAAIARRMAAHGEAQLNEFMLRVRLSDQGHDYRLSLFRDGRAIIQGTDDPAVARSLYAKYVGN